MSNREEARAQALEEMGDNVAHLPQIHRYCSGWRMKDESPGPGYITLWKDYPFPGGCVQARIEIHWHGKNFIKMEVRDTQ